AEKSGAIEVASSTNGQLTPPVMGAAAFLMAEFTGVPYIELLKNAILPAIVSYIALIYIVHLEALKLGLKGLERPPFLLSTKMRLLRFLTGVISVITLLSLIYYALNLVTYLFPDLTIISVILISAVAYLVLIAISARVPDLKLDNHMSPISSLPRTSDVTFTGLYYILPIVILIWCILPTPNRLSPALSASWACFGMLFITLTQHPLKAFFRNEKKLMISEFQRGISDCCNGMISGARAMVSISIATAAAGIIIGSLSLSGAHNVILEFIEILSGGSLMLLLIMIAVISLILGMGLPTTANYIVVSALMAPVIITLGAKNGLTIPLVAAHLFVFYFGILADDTPPVGLAAFAAAAISGGDPIKTGIQGFMYDIRTAVLPFLFIFNTELLLIDVSFMKAIFIFALSIIAMMLFAAFTQGYFFAKNYVWESIAILIVAFTLMRPGFWLDQLVPEFERRNTADIIEVVEQMSAGSKLQLTIYGPNFVNPDKIQNTILTLKVGNEWGGLQRLAEMDLDISIKDSKITLIAPKFNSRFEQELGVFDFYHQTPVLITAIATSSDRFPKEVFYIPALLILVAVIFIQRQRQTQPAF
ncbi:MAG: TRAP transporter permease, partial [Hyphomicrobiaceae bacterium]|nr:TRAP transporter permease [Hyphomicrobiaceae bacterium]